MSVVFEHRKLDELINNLEPRAERVLDDVSGEARNRAAANAPKGETGRLSRGIRVIRDRLERRITDSVDYGVFVELGTDDTPARPFMLPALLSVRDSLIRRLPELFR